MRAIGFEILTPSVRAALALVWCRLHWLVVFVESSSENREGRAAIRELTARLDEAQAGVASSLNLNIVFHVPGRTFRPEFGGVRTGRFSKRDNELMVQVALPASQPPDPEFYVRDAAVQAIDEAERWAVGRHAAEELSELRPIVLSL